VTISDDPAGQTTSGPSDELDGNAESSLTSASADISAAMALTMESSGNNSTAMDQDEMDVVSAVVSVAALSAAAVTKLPIFVAGVALGPAIRSSIAYAKGRMTAASSPIAPPISQGDAGTEAAGTSSSPSDYATPPINAGNNVLSEGQNGSGNDGPTSSVAEERAVTTSGSTAESFSDMSSNSTRKVQYLKPDGLG
jgi:hypothetical protein